MSQDSLPESVAALSRYFVGDSTLEETLLRVAELMQDALPGADFVGLTMPVEGRQRTAVFTDPESPEIDEAQYDSGEGPCLEAYRDGLVHVIESTLEEKRWPAFCALAAEHGVRSTMSLPLIVGDRSVGALNVYSHQLRAFDEEAVRVGTAFAAQAAVLLANAQAYWDAHQLGVGLTEAMEFRAVIEQAKGIIMASRKCSADAAFQILVEASKRENLKLRAIAQRIVEHYEAPEFN